MFTRPELDLCVCEANGICQYVSVRVCAHVLCYPSPPPPLPRNRLITYVNCAQAKTLKQISVSMKSLHSSAMLRYLSLPFQLKTKLHFLHGYYTLIKHGSMPKDTAVPEPQATIRDSHSFLCKALKHTIGDLIWKCDLWARDGASVCVKVSDSIILLSVCTLTVKEWEPGTVSAWSHSNLDVLLWGLSLPLLLGFRATHTHTYTQTAAVTNSYRELYPHYSILFPFSSLILIIGAGVHLTHLLHEAQDH